MRSSGNLTTGILIGIGISAAAYYYYMNNKNKVDDFLRSQGITLPEPAGTTGDYKKMSLEELVSTKETIEDLIAEMEHKMKGAAEEK